MTENSHSVQEVIVDFGGTPRFWRRVKIHDYGWIYWVSDPEGGDGLATPVFVPVPAASTAWMLWSYVGGFCVTGLVVMYLLLLRCLLRQQ